MDITNDWAASGPADEHQRMSTVPAFIEVAPGEFEPIDECKRAELRAAADSKLLQARALMDEARSLYEKAAKL